MGWIKGNKAIVYALLICISFLLAQSCSTTKRRGCGCGANINGVYDRHPVKRRAN